MADIEKLDLKSKNITDEQKTKLKELFPEVITEGRIDFEKLRLTLGDEIDEGEERFGMTWPGKRDCFKVIQEPSIGTLKPCREESVDFDATENLFIEGDNLETLKLLQKSYYGKVKMLYIDPPYNTGNEFIYPDKYSESLETYLAYTGQVDDEGKKFSTNTEADGRFHSKWLNMMYPRLFLAKNLLRDDGVIFISIDDNEVKNLRALCDEIFGEENIISQFVWRSRLGKGGTANQVANIHEYVIVYAKSAEKIEFRRDVKISNGGRERLRQWGQGDRREDRPSMYYLITGPNGVNVFPIKPDGTDGRWRIGKEKMEILLSEGLVEFEKRDDGLYEAYRTIEAGRETFSAVDSILSNENASTTAGGSKELKALFDGEQYYDYPKPSTLIEYLVGLCLAKDAVILDFFSGSCTTAHAVLDLNKEDGGNRKFIMVQLPEPCEEKSEAYKAGYKNIADIGKERIRRVIKKINKEKEGTLDFGDSKQDLGFKVFKLD
ncbi:MAG: site-specific DNA-methyltransferase, partial [Deltaproteobacteria bacterium]|nr:site-specific DNA-methyltransferase [Deltaproteobacteria bacterium]